MKTNYLMKQLKQFSLATLITTTALTSTQLFAGDRVGNGGDTVATHFYEIATRVGKVTASICQSSRSEVCSSEIELQELINNQVTIFSEKIVRGVDGRERDAINNDKDSITVSRTRWKDMELSLTRNEKRVRLVLHEYLSILGLEKSDNYSISTKFIKEIKDGMFDINTIAGKYIEAPKTVLEYTSPEVLRGGEHIMFLASSDKNAVCRILSKSANAKVISYTTQSGMIPGRKVSFAKAKKTRLKIRNWFSDAGSTVINHIVCSIKK